MPEQGPSDEWAVGEALLTRQVAEALGIQVHQLRRMVHLGEASPKYQINQKLWLWEASEVRRLMSDSAGGNRMWKRRRKARPKPVLNGMQPFQAKVRVKRTFNPPPEKSKK